MEGLHHLIGNSLINFGRDMLRRSLGNHVLKILSYSVPFRINFIAKHQFGSLGYLAPVSRLSRRFHIKLTEFQVFSFPGTTQTLGE